MSFYRKKIKHLLIKSGSLIKIREAWLLRNMVAKNLISIKNFNFPYKDLEIPKIDLPKLINPRINLNLKIWYAIFT
jgi:hypothetical protein